MRAASLRGRPQGEGGDTVPDETNLQQVKVYLLKPTIVALEDAIRTGEDVPHSEVVELRADLPFEAILLVRRPRPKRPDWLPFLESGTAANFGTEFQTATAGAALLIRAAGRVFALTFGFGRGIMKSDCFVRDFGVKVVLNAVDPQRIKSVELRAVDTMTLQTRQQASKATGLGSYRVDTRQDLFRGLAGKAKSDEFAVRMEGSDALSITSRVEFDELADKCETLLSLYEDDGYRESFPFFDRLRPVRDPDEVRALEALLDEDLASMRLDRMHLAPPEVVDSANVASFAYSQTGSDYRELDVSDMLSELSARRRSGPVDAACLKQHDVFLTYREVGQRHEKWTVFDCLNYETEIDGALFVLNNGDWHKVDKDFVAEVASCLNDIHPCDIELPVAGLDDDEDQYNDTLCESVHGALLHRKTVKADGTQTFVEVCDVLTPDKHLIHVKPMSASSRLSHLFAQGQVSAELLMGSRSFRREAHAKLETHYPELATLIDVDAVDPRDYEVVFAIIGGRADGWPHSLPFFSQVNLADTTIALKDQGYRVTLARVEREGHAA